jgi:hypothetical protein
VADCGVELRVGLATLMGLVEQPGEIAGLGTILPSAARSLAIKQRRGQWRFVIVDEQGRWLFDGLTRHRPAHYPAGGAKGGIVEVHVPTCLLDEAFLEEHPAWARLLTDLAKQYEQQAPIEQDPHARMPGNRLRRRVQITHRSCTYPGCRRPATDSETDHRHDYAHGGPSLEDNLGPACKAHHALKTKRGWRLLKPDQHTYLWISPLGRRHLSSINPIAPPLPEPMPTHETSQTGQTGQSRETGDTGERVDNQHDPDPPDAQSA